MKRTLLLATIVALGLAARAGADPGGNISWDHCWPEGGTAFKYYACTPDDGYEELVGSFSLAAPLPLFCGVEATLDGHTADHGMLPQWWQLWNNGACRMTSLSVSFDFAAEPHVACSDPWQGASVGGGIGAFWTAWFPPPYPYNAPPSDQFRLKVAGASVEGFDLQPGVEYYAFRLRIMHTKSTELACTGCDKGLCMNLTYMGLYSNAGIDARVQYFYTSYFPPYTATPSQPRNPGVVSWQCATGSWSYAAGPPPAVTFGCTPIANCTVAAQNRTWGSIKALYR